VAASIVSLEALTFAVLAVLELLDVSSGRVGLGVGATAFLIVIAGGLAWAASRVVLGESWARMELPRRSRVAGPDHRRSRGRGAGMPPGCAGHPRAERRPTGVTIPAV
jgi:hypothetical protein